MFVDEAEVVVEGGRGGNGIVAFRREANNPKGGPAGGDGGPGGDVIFVATNDQHTLTEFQHVRKIEAQDGEPGGEQNRTGARGEDRVVEVPVGTVITDAESGQFVADLDREGKRVVVAEGGDRGFGNKQFVSASNQAPRKYTEGTTGDRRRLELELKLIADVGLVGFPSVGKSTLISAISEAKPEVAEYHFTTKVPNLGTVRWRDFRDYVVADIPGLIEDAHEGRGLGDQFLKHIERTGFLVHVLEVHPEVEGVPSERDPIRDFQIVERELEEFNSDLVDRPKMIVLNKIDLPYVRDEIERVASFADERQIPFCAVSAATGENLQEFRDMLGRGVYGEVRETSAGEWWEES